MNTAVAAMLIAGCLCAGATMAKPHQPIDSVDALDEQIQVTLTYLANGEIDQARLLARQIAWRFPDFALGKLIWAELESSSAFRDVLVAPSMAIERNVSELLLEAQRRLSMSTMGDHMPSEVIQLGTDVSDLVVVDLARSTLFQYEVVQKQSVPIRQHYVGSGEAGFGKLREGDLKTPLGVYSITSFIDDAALPDLYGSGALTLDYPNPLDTYLERTGYGIWLHGVPSRQISRTPYSSEGCVTMSNKHLTRIANELDILGTRVILTDTTAPISQSQRKELQNIFRQLFTTYQAAWLQGDVRQLSSLYSNADELQTRLASGHDGLMKVGLSETPTYQQAFARIQSQDITVIRHPQLLEHLPDGLELYVMSSHFGANKQYQITIYWSVDADGQWRVLTDSVQNEAL